MFPYGVSYFLYDVMMWSMEYSGFIFLMYALIVSQFSSWSMYFVSVEASMTITIFPQIFGCCPLRAWRNLLYNFFKLFYCSFLFNLLNIILNKLPRFSNLYVNGDYPSPSTIWLHDTIQLRSLIEYCIIKYLGT